MQNHESSNIEKLLLIKASAGSGKTHRLTGEYLRLLFSDDNQYKYILAVTFTNKATEEMKTRIVDELYILSEGDKSDYHDMLKFHFALSDEQVKERARIILENILHDYSSFSISTIDKFFQQTMRAFAREMGLAGGYRLELDQTAILNQIIDLMILELDKPHNKDLSKWILDYMKNQIVDGKSWNIKNSIGGLSTQLFNEKYKLLSSSNKDQIDDKDHLKKYRTKLLEITISWEKKAEEIGKRAISIMSNHDIDATDIKWGRGSGFILFTKWANKDFVDPSNRLINCADNLDNWFPKKSDKRTEIEKSYYNGLNDCVKSVVALSENNLHYNTAKSILRNFYTLGILNDISNRLQIYQKENNTLFLSDTTELLNKIIADSDAPFIYEKTGTRIVNFMIDEFQDTSSMQWENFRPLISESLSTGNFNLIVGDVKQSIYRWRNSDWGLLENEIPKDFGHEAIINEVLDTNWRSDANIVNFNNAVFHHASRLLQAEYDTVATGDNSPSEHKILDAYQHVSQLVPEKKSNNEGHIKIEFIDEEDSENSWQEEALNRLPRELQSLQDQGFALKDIAILVRKNKEAVMVAEYLLKYKEENLDSKYRYDIISNEALVIGNAQSVRAAIALIRYFNNKKDETKKMLAVYEYNRFHRNLTPERSILDYFESGEEHFPVDVRDRLNEISTLPFYEMVEAFFAMHTDVLDEKENVYVQAFLDIVLKFSTESSSNAGSFIEWWDESGYKKTLFSPDNQDAIHLTTIHKSKGLGFKAVVLPFLKWDIDHSSRGPVLWCKPEVEPFNMLDAVPIVYSSSLSETIFIDEYLEEKLYTYIDNLNLLYVAFTRAKNRIVAFAPKPKPLKDTFKDISSLLWHTFEMSKGSEELINLNEFLDTEANVFELGTLSAIESKAKEMAVSTFESSMWKSIPFDNRLKLRLNSIGFFSDDGSRAYGTLMHDIISAVKTIDDLDKAIDAKYMSGEIEVEKKDEIKEHLKEVLSNDIVSDWYSGKYRVINETQVLHPKFGFSRPDRVMIGDNEVVVVDYKFGEVEDKKYIKQVEHYVRLIKEMGYDNVSGYVFYVINSAIYKV